MTLDQTTGDEPAWCGAPPAGERLVVVAPHPDDEVLSAGGLMRWAADHGRELLIVAVTDGEASHAASALVDPAELRRRRAGERTAALARLGVPEIETVRLRIADQGCASAVGSIVAGLRVVLRPGDTVVGPSGADRHPDHVAVADAVTVATQGVVAERWEAPTWALWHGTAPTPDHTLQLDGTSWLAKCHAMLAFESQLVALGPDAVDGPVVHPDELAAMLRQVEQFVGDLR